MNSDKQEPPLHKPAAKPKFWRRSALWKWVTGIALAGTASSTVHFYNQSKELKTELAIQERERARQEQYKYIHAGSSIFCRTDYQDQNIYRLIAEMNETFNEIFGERSVATIFLYSYGTIDTPENMVATLEAVSKDFCRRYGIHDKTDQENVTQSFLNSCYRNQSPNFLGFASHIEAPNGERIYVNFVKWGEDFSSPGIRIVEQDQTWRQFSIQDIDPGSPYRPEEFQYLMLRQILLHEAVHTVQYLGGRPGHEQQAELGSFTIPLFFAARKYGVDSPQFEQALIEARQIWALRTIARSGSMEFQQYNTIFSGYDLLFTDDGAIVRDMCARSVSELSGYMTFFEQHIIPYVKSRATDNELILSTIPGIVKIVGEDTSINRIQCPVLETVTPLGATDQTQIIISYPAYWLEAPAIWQQFAATAPGDLSYEYLKILSFCHRLIGCPEDPKELMKEAIRYRLQVNEKKPDKLSTAYPGRFKFHNFTYGGNVR